MAWPQRFRQCVMNRPASFKSSSNRAFVDADHARPLADCQRLAVMCQHARVRLIDRLGGPRNPLAITWFVVTVIVGAFKRVALWASSHIGEERSETMAPALAHRDATRAISLIPRVVRIRAALLRIRPCDVFACSAVDTVAAVAMVAMHVMVALSHDASTASRVAPTKEFCQHHLLLAAIATTAPSRATVLCGPTIDDHKASEALPSQVHELSHTQIVRHQMRTGEPYAR